MTVRKEVATGNSNVLDRHVSLGRIGLVAMEESTLLALSAIRCHAQKSVAIGGGADMDDRTAMADSHANDPKQTSTRWPLI